MQSGPRLMIQLSSGQYQELAIETKNVASMTDLQEAVADACERALPESEQERLGELTMQMVDASGTARTVTERMPTKQLLSSRELRLVSKQTAADEAAAPPALPAPPAQVSTTLPADALAVAEPPPEPSAGLAAAPSGGRARDLARAAGGTGDTALEASLPRLPPPPAACEPAGRAVDASRGDDDDDDDDDDHLELAIPSHPAYRQSAASQVTSAPDLVTGLAATDVARLRAMRERVVGDAAPKGGTGSVDLD